VQRTVFQFDHHVSTVLGGNEQLYKEDAHRRRMIVMGLHDIDI
jgi:hypothetical protein